MAELRKSVRARFWVETALAGTALVLAALTLDSREWIEALFRMDPDGGNGSLEWVIVAGFLLIAMGLGRASRREWGLAAEMTMPEVSS